MHIVFTHDSPCNESGEQSIQAKVVTALWETLEKRTYIVPILNDLPYTDQYENDEARKCFRAAMYCIENDLWREAFEWYKKGSELFCGKQDFVVQYDAHSDVSVHYNFHDNEWQVFVETWFNTMYGSAHKWLLVGYIANEAYIDTSDRALEKRNEDWDAMIAERKRIKHEEYPHYNEADQKGIDFTYDEE
jgi:hypothetical protein